MRDYRRAGGGRGLRGGAEKIDNNGVFPGRLQSFRYQRRPVDDCSPRRGRMARRKTAQQKAERLLAKLIAPEKIKDSMSYTKAADAG